MYVCLVVGLLVSTLSSAHGQGSADCAGLTCDPTHTAACNQVTGQCECSQGWTGTVCTEDVDECSIGQHNCTEYDNFGNYQCVNTEGGFECRCNGENGYIDDGNGQCVPIECGGILTEPSGIFTSPNFPENYFNYANCTWTISVGKNDYLSIKFSDFDLEHEEGCSYDYVELYDGPTIDYEHRIGRYCGTSVPYTIQPKSNIVTVQFISDISVTRTGFNASYLSYECPIGTYGVNCAGVCECNKDNTDYCNTRTGQCVCKSGWKSTDCSVDIDECHENPLACPHYSDCKNVIGSFECSCKPGLVQNSEGQCVAPSDSSNCPEGNCLHQCVEHNAAEVCHCPIGMIYEGNECVACPHLTYGPDCARTCDCEPQNTFGCDPVVGICACNADWTGKNCTEDINECELSTHDCEHPISECVNTIGGYQCKCLEENGYTSDENGICVPIKCGGTLTEPSSFFSSPNFPENYFNFANCTWTISVGKNDYLFIKFSAFDLEHEQECSFDYVELYDGPTIDYEHRIGRYCGMEIPNTIQPKSNIVTVQFISDISVTSTGFNASYLSYECPIGTYGVNCAGVCECNKDNTDYCNARTGQCVCKSGWKSTDCSVDVDECHENPLACPHYSDCKNVIGSFECSCKPGLVQNSEGQCVAPSDSSNCPDGNCVHQCVEHNAAEICHCPIGMIYEGNECVACPHLTYGPDCARTCDCEPHNTFGCDPVIGICACLAGWTGKNCTEDINECELWTHDCEHPISECVNTIGSYQCKCLEEEGYTSDENGLCVPIKCGTNLTESSGTFTSPNFPGPYFRNGNCSWTITVGKDDIIALTFEVFVVEDHPDCIYDYVEVFDGPSPNSRLIGRYCGELSPGVITSTSNSMFVVFVTDASVLLEGFKATYTSQGKASLY